MKKHQAIKSPDSSQTILFLDTAVPNLTRIFDFFSGGSANFEIDRQAAAQMTALMPSLPHWIRLRRAFTAEAALILQKEGFNQFLDLGTGMPSEDLIHTFVQDATVIYSDINIVAINYGEGFFSQTPSVDYIFAEVRQLDDLFNHPTVQQKLNRNEKIAIGLNLLPLILLPDDVKRMAHELYAWAPTGSRLFLVVQSCEDDKEFPESYTQFLEVTQTTGMTLELHTLEQNIKMLSPWEPLLLEPILSFLGLPDDFAHKLENDGMDVQFQAAFFVK